MRKVLLLCVVLLAAVVVTSPAVFADNTVTAYVGYGGVNSGGEFDVFVDSWTSPHWVTRVSTLNPGAQFATFCVQENQTFSPGSEYSGRFLPRKATACRIRPATIPLAMRQPGCSISGI